MSARANAVAPVPLGFRSVSMAARSKGASEQPASDRRRTNQSAWASRGLARATNLSSRETSTPRAGGVVGFVAQDDGAADQRGL
jgi:hypothetical protein